MGQDSEAQRGVQHREGPKRVERGGKVGAESVTRAQ